MHVIKEEKREINRFIIQKFKRKGIDSNPEILKAILSEDRVYQMR